MKNKTFTKKTIQYFSWSAYVVNTSNALLFIPNSLINVLFPFCRKKSLILINVFAPRIQELELRESFKISYTSALSHILKYVFRCTRSMIFSQRLLEAVSAKSLLKCLEMPKCRCSLLWFKWKKENRVKPNVRISWHMLQELGWTSL